MPMDRRMLVNVGQSLCVFDAEAQDTVCEYFRESTRMNDRAKKQRRRTDFILTEHNFQKIKPLTYKYSYSFVPIIPRI